MLSSVPAYAEWMPVNTSDEESTLYVDLDTIRRKGDLVKMWELLDYKTAQSVEGVSHLSVKAQLEFDCAEERSRLLAFLQYSGNMGRGKVVLTSSNEAKWAPVPPDTIGLRLWTVACSKK